MGSIVLLLALIDPLSLLDFEVYELNPKIYCTIKVHQFCPLFFCSILSELEKNEVENLVLHQFNRLF